MKPMTFKEAAACFILLKFTLWGNIRSTLAPNYVFLAFLI